MSKYTKPSGKIPVHRSSLGIGTLAELVGSSADKYSGRTAYRTPGLGGVIDISYGRVFEVVTKFARHLKELGIEKGDHVAVLGENRPEWGMSLFALAWIGAVAVPLDARASAESHKFILSFSSSKAVIASNEFLSEIKMFAHELPQLKHVVSMDGIYDSGSGYAQGTPMENVRPGDLLEILFTSGTTGDPKGVMLTHGNIMSNVDDIYRTIEYYPTDRAFSILPIHHSYECTGGLITTFGSGMSVFYARGMKPRELLEDMKSAKPTIWLSAPLIMEKLYLRIRKEIASQTGLKKIVTGILPESFLKKKIRQSLGLEDARLIVSGGAALPPWVSEGLAGYGLDVIQGYGLSEASPLITVNPPSRPKPESIGMAIPSDEVEIREVNDEGVGEIAARGPNIMQGYYRNSSATGETLTPDGWLLTGDVGYFDDEGYLYITGRKKSVIVTRGGKNVYPEEVEEKLTKSPLIEEALVFSPDDSDIQAVIYPSFEEARIRLASNGMSDSPENMWELVREEVRAVNAGLEPYKRVRHFALRTEEFPKTTTRKIKRYLFKGLSLTPDTKIL